jgi:hypothetical protein
MAEDGARTARQHGGHPHPRSGQPTPANRVDPAVHRMQPLSLHAVANRPATEPERDQLGMRHGSVLPVGQLREEGVRRARSHFDSYVMFK